MGIISPHHPIRVLATFNESAVRINDVIANSNIKRYASIAFIGPAIDYPIPSLD